MTPWRPVTHAWTLVFLGAVSSMDVQSVMDCFLDSSDLVVVLYGNVLRGSAAVRRFLTDLPSRIRTADLTINEASHWNVGETVFGVGTATYECEAQDGSKSVLKGCWTDARQKVAGRWVYILAHAAQVAGHQLNGHMYSHTLCDE